MTQWWWLSFCDRQKPKGEQFLGACVVGGDSIREALAEAHRLGINPGGEVLVTDLVGQTPPEGIRNRLMGRAEAASQSAAPWAKEQP